jgi:hypothetical protein
MTRDQVYNIIKEFLEKRELHDIPLLKEGLLVRRPDSDYIIKVTKKKV